MQRQRAGKRFGMRHRDDPVLAAPNELRRHCQRGERRPHVDGLAAVRKPGAGNRFERRLHAVEPLIAQRLFDHQPADQGRVVDQDAEHLLHLAPPLRLDEAVDEGAVDLGAETGGASRLSEATRSGGAAPPRSAIAPPIE
jgi:hypothetical protein